MDRWTDTGLAYLPKCMYSFPPRVLSHAQRECLFMNRLALQSSSLCLAFYRPPFDAEPLSRLPFSTIPFVDPPLTPSSIRKPLLYNYYPSHYPFNIQPLIHILPFNPLVLNSLSVPYLFYPLVLKPLSLLYSFCPLILGPLSIHYNFCPLVQNPFIFTLSPYPLVLNPLSISEYCSLCFGPYI